MSSGSYNVKGWAKYTGNSGEAGHSGSFEGSNDRIGENLSHSVPIAGGKACESAKDLVVNNSYRTNNGE